MMGATVHENQVEFRVWAPNVRELTLRLRREGHEPQDFPMRSLGASDFGPADFSSFEDADTWAATLDAKPGDRYSYVIDGREIPDPVSRFQPEGVHGPSEIVNPAAFQWTDEDWRGIPFSHYVLYELHVGTFTPEGTLDAIIPHLEYLKELGVTAIELMPVNAFPGKHNWGYDGVGLYAVQASYGGPEALRRLVDAAHSRGLAVVLDVVYNHLGNEGNYLRMFGPYFTARHSTPWGEAVNYDDTGCSQVRSLVVENALYWLREYHLDGLRLDAVQTIRDDSTPHIVREIAERAHEFGQQAGRTICIMPETDENDARYVLPVERGGYDVDAIWSDDFHHALHRLFTGENQGYYQDFDDRQLLVRALNEGFAFQGEMFCFWRDHRGTSAADVPLPANIICIQNHDQVGNRAKGERLTQLAPRGARKLAAALLLLAPHTPLLFMGQEYDEPAPFQFFTDYGDPTLQKAVSEGRRKEFADFRWGDVPDPQDPATFERSRLTWPQSAEHVEMLQWYRYLLHLRHELVFPAPRTCRAEWVGQQLLRMQVPAQSPQLVVLCGFQRRIDLVPEAHWRLEMESTEDDFHVRVYRTESETANPKRPA